MSANKLIIQPKSLHGEDGYKVFSVRLKNNLFNKIEDACAKSGYNRNEVTTILIEYALNNMIIDQHKMTKEIKVVSFTYRIYGIKSPQSLFTV